MAYWASGSVSEAEPLLRQDLEGGLARLDAAATMQSERQQFATLRALRDRLDRYLSLSDAMSSDDALYQFLLVWKGCVFHRQRVLRLMRQSDMFQATRAIGSGKGADGQEIILFQGQALATQMSQLANVSKALATLAYSPSDPKTEDSRRKQIDGLSAWKERLEAELFQAASVSLAVEATLRKAPDEIRAALPADSVLIDCLEYVRSEPPHGLEQKWSSERHFVAFVIAQSGPAKRVELGPAAPLTELIDVWRKDLARRTSESGHAAELRRLVWEPLVPHLAGAKVVLLSPDGSLARLPFAALPGKAPGKYLLEEVATAVVPVPQLLPNLLEDTTSLRKPSLLLVGEVNFQDAAAGPTPADVDRSAVRGSLRTWGTLAGTGVEITAVGRAFGRRFQDAEVRELRQDLATEDTVGQLVVDHRFLHFATHGFFSPSEVQSALASAAGGNSLARAGSPRNALAEYHPGLLSGLVLAGANRPAEPNTNDGILTALEVAELDLTGVELATLSACETGLGQVAGGEGLLGLQRAFHTAGARSVVAGLWQVPDRATQVLMAHFYENLWQHNMEKLEALRQAQLWMLREASRQPDVLRGLEPLPDVQSTLRKDAALPPYYWAAFVLSGDPY